MSGENKGVPFPIMLERVFFTRSVVIALADYKPGNGLIQVAPENKLDVTKLDGEQARYMATMRTVMNKDGDPSSPYTIEMECIGLFIAEAALSPEEANRAVTITSHNVLYGAIREAVSWITGRQPHGPFMLGLSILTPPAQPK